MSIESAIREVGISPNCFDSNFEAANLVDGLYEMARAMNRVAKALERLAPPQPEEPKQTLHFTAAHELEP